MMKTARSRLGWLASGGKQGPGRRRVLASVGWAAVLVVGVAGGASGNASPSRLSSQARPGSRAANPVIVSLTLVDQKEGHFVDTPGWLYLPIPGKSSLLVAAGRTDKGGRLVLTAPMSSLLRKLSASNGGWLNLDLLVGDARFYVYRSVARKFSANAWIGTEDAGGAVDLKPLVLAPDAPGVAPTSGKRKPASRFTQSAGRSASCTETAPVTLASKKLPTPVGELHTRAVTASFTYGPTAGSTVDTAFTYGTSSPWTLAGTTNVANSIAAATVNAPTNFNELFKSSFRYVKERTFNTCYGYRYTIKAKKWLQAKLVDSGPAVDPTSNCAPPYNTAAHEAMFNGSFTRNANPAIKYVGSVSLAPFGVPVSLGAASGYSANVKAKWPASVVLCGDTGPPSSSQRIFAG